jgi:uncharacterized protein YjiS (DUF1127 family)
MTEDGMHSAPRFLSGLRRLVRRLERLMAVRREMQMLLRADERALKDIGLTRGEAEVAAHCRFMARAAAKRRHEAMSAARQRKGRTVAGAAQSRIMVARASDQMVGLHGTGTSR